MPVEYAGYIPTSNWQQTTRFREYIITIINVHPRGRARLAFTSTTLAPMEKTVAASPTEKRTITQPQETTTTMCASILGEHALRYMDENPIAAMRLSDPNADTAFTPSAMS